MSAGNFHIPHLSSILLIRFKEEAARFLNSLDAWAQAEDQARQTYAANMQRLYV